MANLRKGNTMKKYLLGAAAALAFAAPGVASAQSAYVDLGYSSSETDNAGVEDDGEGLTAGGAIAFSSDGALGFQLDALIGQSEGNGGGDIDTVAVGGHAFTRNDNHLLGAFANIANVDAGSGNDFDHWTGGLEGQIYMSRTTLDGVVSYSNGDQIDTDLVALDLGATHFVTDNFSLGANVGYGQIDDSVNDSDVVTYGVGAEYQIAAMPFSIFGGYQHAEINDTDSDSETLSVGVRYNWGGSLLDRNRSGPSLARGVGLGRIASVL